MNVVFDNLTKRFGDVVAVDSISMEVRDGEFVALLGPSGCGKTTTLLMTAGIYRPSAGAIRFGERVMNRVQPKDRNIGMVFQSYALYPHMTVYENIVFPMKLKKTPKAVMDSRAKAVAEKMGIAHLMDRRPGQLSGGQQQRVALGRALAKQPDLLLFDEPLSNLDARLRLTMRAEIKRLQMELGITAIYVTHDQVEAMTMADRIAVIKDGRLQAYCTPDELYDQPQTLFIAGFVGNPPMNFLDVEVVQDGGAYRARAAELDVPVDAKRAQKAAGRGAVVMGIRPEDVSLSREAAPGAVAGEVFVVEPLGRDDLVTVKMPAGELHVLTDPAMDFQIGEPVYAKLQTERVQFFDPATGLSLIWR
ncbi:MAG TPA: ABC transporter ATP-binding protein [Caldilineaceae bacterium]|nr:ABC transporter ATP-binding protein [Caldilineaceae bacterium]